MLFANAAGYPARAYVVTVTRAVVIKQLLAGKRET